MRCSRRCPGRNSVAVRWEIYERAAAMVHSA